MENRSDGGWAAAAICVIAILILLVGGGGAGIYYILRREQMVLAMQAERAALAEAEARMQAERSRADAEAAMRVSRTVSDDPSSTDADSTRTAIEAILRAQEEAWNRGDLDAFMEHYWKSDSLTFSSGGKTTRGWAATLQRYRERYPTPEATGHLKLSELEITLLGDSAALVLGKWSLQRESEPVSGGFSLVFRNFDNGWLIVHDHTSRTME
jgi:beta-aspartyl-peptidase (threonine type)